MADYWASYESLLGINGEQANARDMAIDGAVNAFIDGIMDDPAYQKDAMIDGVIVPLIASPSSSIQCSIKAFPFTDIHIGDMVECFDKHWIVVELYTDKIGIINGEMWLCNEQITFQNNSTPVYHRYCVIDNGTYSKKSSDPDAFVMNNTYKIYLSKDSITEKLYVDKRLGFGEIYASDGSKILEVYKIIGIDLKSKNFGDGGHLMVLTLQRDVYNAESDSIELNLCDYYKDEGSSTPSVSGSCIISGRDSIRIGTSRKFVTEYFDDKGHHLDGVTSNWDISVPEGVTYNISDNICYIDVPLDSSLVGAHINLNVTDSKGLYGNFEKKVQVITVG